MGKIRSVLSKRALTGRVSTTHLKWPEDSDELRVELDESSFTSGAVMVTVEATWDGVTFPWRDVTGPFRPGYIGSSGIPGCFISIRIGTTSAEDADWTAAAAVSWIAAVAAFEPADSGAAVIQEVQSASKTVAGVNNTTLAFGSNIAAGNWIGVTQASFRSGGNVIQTPTDTRGHTYLSMAAQVGPNASVALRSYYAESTTAGANTVTFDMDGTGTGEISCTVAEFSGVKTSSSLNTSNTANATSAAVSSGNVTPTVNNVALTEEAGWTLLQKRVQASTLTVATEWKIGTTHR